METKNIVMFQQMIVPIATYTLFKNRIQDVEEAFRGNSTTWKFISLIILCEGIVTHILRKYRIPHVIYIDDHKFQIQASFAKKLEQLLIMLSPNPTSEIEAYIKTKNAYQQIRNLLFHGDPYVVVTEKDIVALQPIIQFLLQYDLEELSNMTA